MAVFGTGVPGTGVLTTGVSNNEGGVIVGGIWSEVSNNAVRVRFGATSGGWGVAKNGKLHDVMNRDTITRTTTNRIFFIFPQHPVNGDVLALTTSIHFDYSKLQDFSCNNYAKFCLVKMEMDSI